MINHNMLFDCLFDRTIEVCFNGGKWKANYVMGDLFELEKELSMKETKYPIIWLKSGFNVSERLMGREVTLSNCTFGLITIGDANDLYKTRFKTNYEGMLYPLYEKFKEVFKKNRGIRIASETIDSVEYPFNNVSELLARDRDLGRKRNGQTATIQDIWDAIFIDNLSITINEDCYPQFKIKK